MRKERDFSIYSREFFYAQFFFLRKFLTKIQVFRFWSGNFPFLFTLSPKVIHKQNRYTPVRFRVLFSIKMTDESGSKVSAKQLGVLKKKSKFWSNGFIRVAPKSADLNSWVQNSRLVISRTQHQNFSLKFEAKRLDNRLIKNWKLIRYSEGQVVRDKFSIAGIFGWD
jgi:hypothetical protein